MRGKRLHPAQTMAAGATASAGSQILTYPLALVRVRMQAQAGTSPPVSMRNCIAAVARADGLSGFYRARALLPHATPSACVLHCTCRMTAHTCSSLAGQVCSPFGAKCVCRGWVPTY
jgi:Mitochondrial carrier protein